MDLQLIAATASVVLGVIAPLPYIRDTFWGKTRPHIFSWFIWTITVLAGFYGQVVGGAGWGAAALGVTVIMNIVVLIAALVKSRDYINKFDAIVLVFTLLSFLPWWVTDSPVVSILLLAAIDASGFLPTIRKAYSYPETESVSLYLLSALKHGLSIYALAAFNVLTLTFPVMLLSLSLVVVTLLTFRKSTEAKL